MSHLICQILGSVLHTLPAVLTMHHVAVLAFSRSHATDAHPFNGPVVSHLDCRSCGVASFLLGLMSDQRLGSPVIYTNVNMQFCFKRSVSGWLGGLL